MAGQEEIIVPVKSHKTVGLPGARRWFRDTELPLVLGLFMLPFRLLLVGLFLAVTRLTMLLAVIARLLAV